MLAYFEQLFDLLNTRDHQIIIMTVYVICLAVTLLLRGVTCAYFNSLLLRFRMDAKEIKSVDEIKNIRFALLRRLAAEYTQIAVRNVTRVPTQALVERQLARLNFMGWRYTNIMPFVELMESGLLWVGLIIALLFDEYAIVYGTLAVGGFLLTRLAAAIFDFRSARGNMADELLVYAEREIGMHFPIHINGTILPRLEMTDAATKVYEILSKPLEEWAKNLAEAGRIQGQINDAASKIQNAAEALATPMQDHGKALASLAAEQGNLLKHTKLVEQNQHALETAYQSYEASLQKLVETLGDGLGAYLKLHGQSAAQAVNETLSGNIEKIMTLIQTAGERKPPAD